MKCLVKISLVSFCLFTVQGKYVFAQNNMTQLDCIQGIWKTDRTEDLLNEYSICMGHKSIGLSYTDKELEHFSIFFEGFSDLEGKEITGFGSVKNFSPDDLEASGKYYVSFSEKDALNDSLVTANVQTSLLCEGDIIEMSDNSMTMLEKQSFLPYTAYYHIKEQSKKDGRNYIDEFGILSKLGKAKVTVNKTHFHDAPGENTKLKAFVVQGDQIIIEKVTEHWVKVAYEGKKITTEGWLKLKDVEVLD